MQISCRECGKQFNLPQEKIPETGSFRFNCPACGAKNRIELGGTIQEAAGGRAARPPEKPPEKQVEPEVFPPGSQVALLFLRDASWAEKTEAYLRTNGFYLSFARSKEEGIQKLRLNRYQLVMLEQGPETLPLLEEIASWPGRLRREVNCVLLGEDGTSFDPSPAFVYGVNSYLCKTDKDRAEQILAEAGERFAKHLEPWHSAAGQEKGA